MAEWEMQVYEKELRELVAEVEEVGVEEAVKRFAAHLLEGYSPARVQAEADSLRARHKIKGNDALAAFRLHEAYILSKVPLLVRILWSLAKRVKSGWTTESSPERVVMRTPSSVGRVLCPVVRATGGDLEKARPICEALFRYDAFSAPMSILVAKAANPRIRWELAEYRDKRDFPCYYAIVLAPEADSYQNRRSEV